MQLFYVILAPFEKSDHSTDPPGNPPNPSTSCPQEQVSTADVGQVCGEGHPCRSLLKATGRYNHGMTMALVPFTPPEKNIYGNSGVVPRP